MGIYLEPSKFEQHVQEIGEINCISFATAQNDLYRPLSCPFSSARKGFDNAIERLGTYKFLTICYGGIPDPENLLAVYSEMKEADIVSIQDIIRQQVLLRVAHLRNRGLLDDSSLDSDILSMEIPLLRVKIN